MVNAWKESTQKIFWGVIVIAVAGIFNTVYDYVSIVSGLMSQLANMLPHGVGREVQSFLMAINGVGILVKAIIVVGYVLYLLGLKQFSAIQINTLAAENIEKIRTAVVLLISCFVVSGVFSILPNLSVFGLIVSLGVWIATLVAYFMMKKAFGVLMINPAFSPDSQKGARKLRIAAICNIWVMLMPIIAALLAGLFILGGISAIQSRSGGQSMESLMFSGGVLMALLVICAVVLLIIALIYPFIGWYKIMNGGGDNSQEMGQQPSDVEQQAFDSVQQAQGSVQQPFDNVQQSFGNVQQSISNTMQTVSPKLESAEAWVVANKSKVGIGVAVAVFAALLIWLVPKMFGGGPVEFEIYEKRGDTICANGASTEIWISLDVPKSGGSKQKNVEKAIRELISLSKLAKEIGTPIDGSLKEVADDYINRYLELAAKGDDYGAIRCDLGVVGGYQNESSVVLHFIDGLYGNGGPQEFDYVVRLSDGHIMQQQEMVLISENKLEEIMNRYITGDFSADLREGYHLSPVGFDSCKIIWPIGSHFNGEAIIPISELEPFMTEEGKALFKAKPVGAVSQKPAQDEEVAEVGEDEYEMVPIEERIVFENGKLGPVQVGKPIPQLPQSVDRLYDHFEHNVVEHEGNDMEDSWSEDYYLFTKEGKEIFRANIYEGRVHSIRLLKGSSFIMTPDGWSVGYPVRGLILEKRLDWTNYYDGNVFGTEGRYSYYIDPEDLVQADTPEKPEDIKPSARVIGIEYGLGLEESLIEQEVTAPVSQPAARTVPEKKEIKRDMVSKQSAKPAKKTLAKPQQAPVPETAVEPAPPRPGEKTVNLNDLIKYTNNKK